MTHSPPIDLLELELFLHAIGGAAPTGPVVAQLAAMTHEERYRPGETIHRAGAREGLLRFVVRGDVELRSPGAEPQRIPAPGMIGLADLLERRAHAHTAVALTDVRALVLHGDEWFEVLEENFEFTHSVIVRGASGLFDLRRELAPSGGFPDVPPDAGAGRGSALLDLVERVVALRAVPCFAGATVEALALLAEPADEIALRPGQELRRQGAPARSFFVVASGVVRGERQAPDMHARFGPGSIIGGAAALGLVEHPFTSVAESSAVLLRIRHDMLFDVMEDEVGLIRTVSSALAREREHLLAKKAAMLHGQRSGLRTGGV
jgi:CRP-like cAMP-binding protein